MRFAHFFRRPADLRLGDVDHLPDPRLRRLREAAGLAISGDRAADGDGARELPRRHAETVAATIATPLEQEINGVDNMLYMTSLSTNDGAMLLTVTFKVGTNLDIANVLVQNRLSVAQPRLPRTCAISASPCARPRPT